jgi:hypothetical protein
MQKGSKPLDGPRLAQRCTQLGERDETRKRKDTRVVTREEEGLRKNVGWGGSA